MNTRLPYQLQANLDIQIQQLRDFTIQAGRNPVFNTEYYKNSPVAFYDIISSLRIFANINSFIKQIFYWPSDENIVYSPEGTYKPDILLDKIYIYENLTEPWVRKAINDLIQPVWLPSQPVSFFGGGSAELITYINPVKDISGQKIGAMIFLIEKETVQRLIGDIQFNSCLTNVITADDNVLYYSKPLDYPEIINVYNSQSPSLNEGLWNRFEFDRNEIFIFKIKSNQQDIAYYTIAPVNDMLQQVLSLQRQFYFIMFCVIIVCSAAALVMIYYNYKPIRKLTGLVDNQKLDSARYSNELDIVSAYLNELSDTSLVYSREQLFFHLLKSSEIENSGELTEISKLLPGPYYRVLYMCILQFPPELKNSLKKKIQSIFANRLFSYVIEFPDRNIFAIVCSTENASEGKLAEDMDFILDEFKNNGIQAEAAAGNIVDSIKLLKESFIQAKNTYIARGIHEHGNFIFPEPDNAIPENPNWFIAQELDALGDAIQQKKPNLIEFTVSALIRQIQPYAGNQFAVNCICYEIINTIFNVMSTTYTNWRYDHYKYIADRLSCENRDDLVIIIKSLCDEVIKDISAIEKTNAPAMNDMITYIDNHFCDPNFSIKWLSAEFGISASNFSHQFKTRMGLTLMEYIDRLKVDYAKKLLEDSSRTVTDVSGKLGYNHPSSFIRKFKQITGKTPGEIAEEKK
ncbi:MAG: AraC family transcriptional regulator [Treponema sp.]|nr:AraC family transcriptional regulator [Treponema sp.]